METDPTTPAPPIPWEDVLQQPWLIQALAVLFFASLVVQLIPKAAGRWSTTVEQWTDSRRRTKSASANADAPTSRNTTKPSGCTPDGIAA